MKPELLLLEYIKGEHKLCFKYTILNLELRFDTLVESPFFGLKLDFTELRQWTNFGGKECVIPQ